MSPPPVRSRSTAPPPWSEDRAGELLDVIPEAALEIGAGGQVLRANDLALQLFGCAAEDLLGHRLQPLLPIDDLLAGGQRSARARLGGRRASGVPVLVETSVRSLDVAGERRALCVLRELNFDSLANEAQRYFDVAFDDAPIGKALFNCDGEYVRVNAALCRLLGRPAAELIGRRDQELTHPDDRPADVQAAWEILAGNGTTHQCEKRFIRPDGSVVWVLANLTFLRDEHGRPLSWFGQFQDITARRAAEEALRESEEHFRLAFEHAPIGIALVSPRGEWLRVNGTLCEMLGYGERELLSSTFQAITHPDDLDADVEHVRRMLAGEIRSYEMEKRYVRADGSTLWTSLAVSLARDGDGRPQHFISQIQDIDARKRAQGELEHLAHHDALTGALNRRAWDRELEYAIAAARDLQQPLAVALIDLNDFKQVNDTYGHAAGDDLLVRAAQLWRAHLREGDRLARLGGDEFAVLLRGDAARHAEAIVRRLKEGFPHPAGCAIGLARWVNGEDARGLLRRADEALYADKAARRVGVLAA